MAKYKTEFELIDEMESEVGTIKIIEKDKYTDPHIEVNIFGKDSVFIRAEDLERFARNILKSLSAAKLRRYLYLKRKGTR